MNVILILVLYFTAMKSLGSGEGIISDINVIYVAGSEKTNFIYTKYTHSYYDTYFLIYACLRISLFCFYFHLFFFLAIPYFLTYYAQYFAQS